MNEIQKQTLEHAIKNYSFPAAYYDFSKNKEVIGLNMSDVELRIGSQLRSSDIQEIKFGLANILFWGYAQIGFGSKRIEKFYDKIDDKQLIEFKNLVANGRVPTIIEIKKLNLPELSGGMSFATKVLTFLDLDEHCVLDNQILKIKAHVPAKLKALNEIKKSDKETLIRISTHNADCYEKWCRECQEISMQYFDGKFRAVDIERGFFNLIQQGRVLEASEIYQAA
ncbi:hypothetical protein LVJ85_06995 [Neisseria sp. Dent CA1/247]|uniref:hypothetical protein n=1 Tax=Neisseria sp. Dent CA1/247 TaxID=2912675 RepID=UPI001FD3CBEF|nr:hypothetical protein [Neisseria sp. Dent CA1/247]UOO75812.1 hypothetical protein LVJ85_06995 [Neisseria sp. Dent CA1/247]